MNKERILVDGLDGQKHNITPCPNRMAYYIGRCPYRKCDCRPVRVGVEMVNKKTLETRHNHAYGTVRCFVDSTWYPATLSRNWGPHYLDIHCIKHRRPLRWALVNGTYSERHKCDARCMSAIGPNCECQCGGKNHGGAYDAATFKLNLHDDQTRTDRADKLVPC